MDRRPPHPSTTPERAPPGRRRRAVALALTLAALLAACGDPETPAAGDGPAAQAAADARPLGPPEAWVDDEAVLVAVVASARTGAPLPPELAKLPPRVSPVRVAVRALHDHLVGVNGAATAWDALLAALDRLAAGDRTAVDRGALAPLVAAWRKWTPEERAAEAAWAEVYARRLDLLRSPEVIDARTAAAEPKLPRPPAMSPAEASLVAVRAALAAVVTAGEDVPSELVVRIAAARKAFEELGWPGGFAPVAEVGVERLERSGKPTLRSAHLRDQVLDAYKRSGDDLRRALVLYDRISDAERQNELRRAVLIAKQSLEQIDATGTRGRETGDALFRLGSLLIATGKPADAAKALERTLAEIAYAGLDPALRTPVGERLATALWFLGRYDEAVAAADGAVKAFEAHVKAPSPAQLAILADAQEIGARAWVDGHTGEWADVRGGAGNGTSGAPDAGDGAKRFLAAAATRARLPGGAGPAAADRLLAADACRRAGRPEEARRLLDEVLAAPEVPAAVRAQASSVLRDLGALDVAERELTRAHLEGSDKFQGALREEFGRLFAAKKAWPDARNAFAEAAARATTGAADASAGWDAARVFLDWARMECDAGDLAEAARLADQATYHLGESPYVVELDRARRLWVQVQRRRGLALDAEKGTKLRLASGPPGPPRVREDAAIDLLVARLAAAAIDPGRWTKAVEEAAAALPEGPARAAALRIARPKDAPAVPGGAASAGRARALALAAGTIDRPEDSMRVARELLAAPEGPEWELSRWVLDRMMDGAAQTVVDQDPIAWADLRRGAGSATKDAVLALLRPGDAFVTLDAGSPSVAFPPETEEPGGEAWHFVQGRHEKPLAGAETWSSFSRLPATGGLTALFQASWGFDASKPERAEASSKRLEAAAAQFLRGRALVSDRDSLWPGAKRVIVSIAPPFGVLPLDLVPRSEGGKVLLDEVEWSFVTSPSEFLACAKRPAPGNVPFLRGPDSPLTERHAVVAVFPVDDAVRSRFASFLEEARGRGLDACAAVRDAKLRLRAEWKPDPKHPSFPPWAAFVLRGAP